MTRGILITGAGGFIGYPTLLAARAEGWEAIGFDLARATEAHADARFLIGDVTDIHRLYRIFHEHAIDTVVHAGGVSGSMLFRDDPYRVCKVNVDGTINLLEAARVVGIRRFVFLSSAQVYGDTPPPPVGEDAPLRPRNLYGATKTAGDLLLHVYKEQYGLDAVALRISNGYGPRRRTRNEILTMLEDALAGRPTVLKAQGGGRGYLYVNDVVSAVIAAVKAPSFRQPAYNVAANQFESIERIVEIVGQVVPNANITLVPDDDAFAPRRERLDITAARRDFGWSPQWTLEKGISNYAAWLRATT